MAWRSECANGGGLGHDARRAEARGRRLARGLRAREFWLSMDTTGRQIQSLGQTEINWDKLDKTKFYVVGAGIFTGVTVALYPISVVKTRLQVSSHDALERNAFSVIKGLLKTDGVPGLYKGFGTVITGAIPVRILFLTALETTKVSAFKLVEPLRLSEPTQAAIANGVAGMMASLCSQAVFVPIDVVIGHGKRPSARQVVRNLIADDGWTGLYRGLGPRFFSMSAWGTSMILAYEYLSTRVVNGRSLA